ncbi:MAG: protein phosphatase 2C domain-containing protein [Actinomycetota bacterium]
MRVDAATLPGHIRNQDAYAILDNAVIVLDGASAHPPTDTRRDGGWYAAELLAALTERFRHGDSDSLTDCLANAISNVRDQHALTPGGPSSTVLIARHRNHSWDLLMLGDSTIVIQHSDGRVDAITDDRLDAIAADVRHAYQDRLRTGSGYDTHHAQLLAQLQDAQRAARDQPAGYWIADSDPTAAAHAITTTLPAHDVRRVALLTDGAADGVLRLHQPPDWEHILIDLTTAGCADMLRAAHAAEQHDAHGQRWPRAKLHDDKTAVLVHGLLPADSSTGGAGGR